MSSPAGALSPSSSAASSPGPSSPRSKAPCSPLARYPSSQTNRPCSISKAASSAKSLSASPTLSPKARNSSPLTPPRRMPPIALEARLYGLLNEARLVAERDGTDQLVLRPGLKVLPNPGNASRPLRAGNPPEARSANLGTQATILNGSSAEHRISGMQNEITARTIRSPSSMTRSAVSTLMGAVRPSSPRPRLATAPPARAKDLCLASPPPDQIGKPQRNRPSDQGNRETVLTERDVQRSASSQATHRPPRPLRCLDILAPRSKRVLASVPTRWRRHPRPNRSCISCEE